MRIIKKQVAQNDAVPPYAVFTDAELAKIAQLESPTLSAIKKIDGIGPAHIEKYGRFFVTENGIEP